MLLPVEDDAELERLVLAYSKQFQGVLQASRAELADGKGISHEDFWKAIDDEAAAQR